MKIYTWQSAANPQGWKKAKCVDGTIILENIKTGKIVDKGFVDCDLPEEAGWIFAQFDIEGEQKLFNVNSERFFEPENYNILSKPNKKGWMIVSKDDTVTFYNIYQKVFSDIKCISAKRLSEDNWVTIQLDDGFTYANPDVNVILQARFDRNYYLSWHSIKIEFPDDYKYYLSTKKDNQSDDESE